MPETYLKRSCLGDGTSPGRAHGRVEEKCHRKATAARNASESDPAERHVLCDINHVAWSETQQVQQSFITEEYL